MAKYSKTDEGRKSHSRTLDERSGAMLDRFVDDRVRRSEGAIGGRHLGAGKACDDPSQIAASIVDGLNCGIEDLEVVAENRAFFEGPLTPAQAGNFFLPQVNPFGIGTAQGAVDQAQINIDGSEMDCNVLITHVYFHMVPPKHTMTVEGGYWSPSPTAAGNGPVVPDAWSNVDQATDGTGTLGLGAGQTLTKASLDTGEWACDFFYDFCRAYEWIWKIGNNILMEAPLTKIASIRGASQPWTSGQHLKPFAQDVADANAFFRANGANGIFMPRNATRDGSANITSGKANSSYFSPYGYFREQATIGGPGVQELCMNPTVYELCTAQLFPRGVKLGMHFDLIDEYAQARSARSATMNQLTGGGGIGQINPDVNVTGIGSGVAPVFTELTQAAADVLIQEPVGRVLCKIGDFYLVAGLMGHRVSQTLYSKIIANESAVCDAVTAGTFGRRSLSMMASK
ncbi:MAG TPA: hypothetical protein VNV25_25645 [Gemmatimonadaceae bacterium]|jgi:hypothetical protein|nr:hypothetical protein [Gemmatimonadaceae bacterium]